MRSVLVLALVVGGCYDAYDVDDYWSELASTHCTVMKYCCTAGEYNDWWSEDDGDVHDCYRSHAAPYYAETVREGIANGRISFDISAAHSCVIALENIACTSFQPGIRYRESYCDPPLRGHLPDGAGTCTIDEECQSRICGVDGLCLARLQPGDPCGSGSGGACPAPTRCQPNGYCGLGYSPGVACNSDAQCIGDWCKDDTLFGSGTCKQACQSGL
jgi:hypothetical protein